MGLAPAVRGESRRVNVRVTEPAVPGPRGRSSRLREKTCFLRQNCLLKASPFQRLHFILRSLPGSSLPRFILFPSHMMLPRCPAPPAGGACTARVPTWAETC